MQNTIFCKLFALSCFFLITSQCVALECAVRDSYENHLRDVNAQWKNYPEASPLGEIAFQSDLDRIQLHLNLVAAYLESHGSGELTTSQKANRTELITALKDYAKTKIFPTNLYHSTRRPYFVDDYNVHCAVGYLMAFSGYSGLVAEIRNDHNYDYIEDIRTPGVAEWAEEHGFTVDELKWIQPGYMPQETLDPIGNGANGPVEILFNNYYTGGIIIAGDFDTLDLIPCLKIGVYENDQFSCLGNGISGTVEDVMVRSTEIIAAGSFDWNGETYPLASFANGSWTYIGIPNRVNAEATAIYPGGSGDKLQVAISHNSIPNSQEIWYLSNADVWKKKAQVNGEILAIAASSYGRVFAGHFDTAIRFDEFGVADSTFSANNVIFYDDYQEVWITAGDEISDTVKTIFEFAGNVYFGGTCSNDPSQSDVCVSRYLNGTLQPIVLNAHFSGAPEAVINTLAYNYSTQELLFGGDFEIYPMIGTMGTNLAKYHVAYNQITAMAVLDAPVNDILYTTNAIYVGGDFDTNNFTGGLNHLAQILSNVGLPETELSETLTASPNPFSHEITLSGITSGDTYSLLNSQGQILKQDSFESSTISGLNSLPSGIYFLKVSSDHQETVLRLVK